MATWRYEAKNSAGKGVSGTLVANDRHTALEVLRGQGLFLTRLEAASKQKTQNQPPISSSVTESRAEQKDFPEQESSKNRPAADSEPAQTIPTATAALVYNAAPRSQSALPPLARQALLTASKRDVSAYFRQLSSAAHAGVSTGKALSTLENHASKPALRNVSGQLSERVMKGEPMSEGMKAFPGLFTPLMIGIVNAGERGGFLDRSFSRLADYAERDYELETSIKRETWYPKLVVFSSILIPGVVPLYLQGFSAFLHQVMPPLIVIGCLWLALKILKLLLPVLTVLEPIFVVLDGIKLYLPIIGKVTRGLATAKFCRAMGALYAAGISPSESVRISANASGNQVMRDRCIRIIPRLEHGESLTSTLKTLGVFHPMALQMMQVGEESGDLDTQLDKAADFLERDSETAIKQAVPVLGILAFLAVAVYVGSLAIAGINGYSAQVNEIIDSSN